LIRDDNTIILDGRFVFGVDNKLPRAEKHVAANIIPSTKIRRSLMVISVTNANIMGTTVIRKLKQIKCYVTDYYRINRNWGCYEPF